MRARDSKKNDGDKRTKNRRSQLIHERRLVVRALSRGFEVYSPKTKCPICGASRDYLKVTKDGLKCLEVVSAGTAYRTFRFRAIHLKSSGQRTHN